MGTGQHFLGSRKIGNFQRHFNYTIRLHGLSVVEKAGTQLLGISSVLCSVKASAVRRDVDGNQSAAFPPLRVRGHHFSWCQSPAMLPTYAV